jgi:hypothetical protein
MQVSSHRAHHAIIDLNDLMVRNAGQERPTKWIRF